MSNMFVISDTHFSHQLLAGIRGFKSKEEMDELMVQNWNSVVKPGDHIYHMGDVAMRKENLAIVRRLNGKKRLLFGNHDIFEHKYYLNAGFQKLSAYRVMDGMIFSHIPIHPCNHGRFKANIHGHMHTNNVMLDGKHDPRYLCVCVEQTNYTPVSLEDIKQILSKRT